MRINPPNLLKTSKLPHSLSAINPQNMRSIGEKPAKYGGRLQLLADGVLSAICLN